MAGLTLAQAETNLAAYQSALSAVLTGQEYKIADRSLKRASLSEIQAGIKYWDAEVKKLSRGGGLKVIGGTPV